MKWAAIAGAMIVVAVVIGLAVKAIVPRTVHESALVPLPGNGGTLTVIREWQDGVWRWHWDVLRSRKIIRNQTGQPARSWQLPADAGYGLWFNVYWIDEPGKSFIRLDDAGGEYLLDLGSNTLHSVFAIEGVKYLKPAEGSEIAAATRLGNDMNTPWMVKVGDKPAIPLANIASDPEGVYIGNICGISHEWRFTPAQDSPKMAIRKLFSDR
jgi:hypothetical protein